MMDLCAHAEVNGEGSNKRPRGRLANVGHIHDEEGLEYFVRVVFQPTMGSCMIPKAFVPCFGKIPSNITLVTKTGCNWAVKTKFGGEKPIIDQGWAAFAIAHELKVGYFLTFHKEALGIYRVVIFDYSCCEVMTRCLDHGDTTRRVMEEEQ